MLTSIFHAGSFSLEAVIVALVTALVLGAVLAGVYMATCTVNGGFGQILIVLPLLVSAVIMIVNGNLGTSVAVLGAFGLVRFRSAPGNAQEILFIFFSMAIGLAVGMGFLTFAVIITAAAGTVLLVIDKTGAGITEPRERMLKITIPEDLNYEGLFDDLLMQYTKRSRLERVKTTNMGTMFELSYRVEMRDPAKAKAMIDDMRCRNGNLGIALSIVQREKNEL